MSDPAVDAEVADLTQRGEHPVSGLDLVVGVSAVAVGATVVVSRRVLGLTRPVVRHAVLPALRVLPGHPHRRVAALAGRGHDELTAATAGFARVLDVLVPALLEEVLRRADLTTLVQRYVELDTLVTGVDLDAVAARLDVDAVAGRLDVEAVLDRIDLTALVRERVDLNAVAAGLDLDLIAGRLDVDAVAARLDVEAVIARVDLVGIAEDVINAIDLPEIIRGSTSAVASETVRGVRMQSIAGDEAVGRLVDRLLLRRQRHPGGLDEGQVPGQRAAGPPPTQQP